MIKIEDTEVVGWRHAIRGMRNALESWERSDSFFNGKYCEICPYRDEDCDPEKPCFNVCLGPNDIDLTGRLSHAGTDHRKFMRMIVVYADVTAPLYWWKEYDTYKIGTVANSCSTMHCIHKHKFTLDDFSHEHLFNDGPTLAHYYLTSLTDTIDCLNCAREKYLETKDKKYWWQMIQLLPTSYNQKRTVMLNYEVLANMYHSRKNHKLDEWRDFCKWIESLPYSEIITGEEIKISEENS